MSEAQTKYRGFIAWMAQNSVAVNLLMIMVMGAGLLSLSSIRQETFPDFNLDIISVSVPYPGATPEEIACNVISLRNLEASNKMRSAAHVALPQIDTLDVVLTTLSQMSKN